MNILGHGIDLVSISRLQGILEKGTSHFEERVFSQNEISYCRKKKNPYPHFAARFAAKEAYGKAMGLGLGPTGDFSEIEVINNEKGAPLIVLNGKAKEIFEKMGGGKILISLTHDGDSAMASVLVLKS